LIVTNSARAETAKGVREGLSLLYRAINITLHESYGGLSPRAERAGDPFVSGQRPDSVAINMLDCVMDCTPADFILLRRHLVTSPRRRTKDGRDIGVCVRMSGEYRRASKKLANVLGIVRNPALIEARRDFLAVLPCFNLYL